MGGDCEGVGWGFVGRFQHKRIDILGGVCYNWGKEWSHAFCGRFRGTLR